MYIWNISYMAQSCICITYINIWGDLTNACTRVYKGTRNIWVSATLIYILLIGHVCTMYTHGVMMEYIMYIYVHMYICPGYMLSRTHLPLAYFVFTTFSHSHAAAAAAVILWIFVYALTKTPVSRESSIYGTIYIHM